MAEELKISNGSHEDDEPQLLKDLYRIVKEVQELQQTMESVVGTLEKMLEVQSKIIERIK